MQSYDFKYKLSEVVLKTLSQKLKNKITKYGIYVNNLINSYLLFYIHYFSIWLFVYENVLKTRFLAKHDIGLTV